MRTPPWFVVVALVFSLLVAFELRRGGLQQGSFKAFYCAGDALAGGANPYLVEPLRSCYHRVDTTTHIPSSVVEPAPLPGYALALFAMLSRLPVQTAQLLYTMSLIAALLVSALLVGTVTRMPHAIVLLGLLPLGYLNIAYGEVPPLLMAMLACAGYFVGRGLWVLASVTAAASMIEPHVGLAACLSILLTVPRCRLPLLWCGAALAAVSVGALGVAGNVTYFSAVLPMQAAAELAANDQYSLSRLLSIAGVQDGIALLLGSLSYVVMLTVGIVLAQRLARVLKAPELVAWCPPAAVLLGGTFVHDVQMMAALPVAFALAARGRRFQTIAGGALIALTVAWTLSAGRLTLLLSIVSSVAILAMMLREAPAWRMATAALTLTSAVVSALFVMQRLVRHGAGLASAVALSSDPRAFAPMNWGAYLRASPVLSVPSLGVELLKAPTWAALIALVIVAILEPMREEAAVAV